MLSKITLPLLFLIPIISCQDRNALKTPEHVVETNWNNEVIYHVMPRSFYDSNGDRHGDLNGFISKLDYLTELGVTAILFTPLYESGFYHNYFPTDYYGIDPEYGSLEDYIDFVEAVHAKGFKFIMDMETQYVQDGHLWFDSTYQNPGSPYDEYVYYSDSLNTLPAQLFFDLGSPLYDYEAWPGDTAFNIATLDLKSPRMLQWEKEFYSYWVDPNSDGDFSDGVDGFRIDHIMDDLDNKGVFSDLYTTFWTPIFDTCRQINPDLFIVVEQADWSEYGDAIVNHTGADAAFNFPLKFTLRGTEHSQPMASDNPESQTWEIDASTFHTVMESCIRKFGPDHYFVNFIENHDTDRFASLADQDERILKLAAVLLATLPGTPSIYYGQELGLTGTVGNWGSDANHIPIREAFPWQPDVNAQGVAAFYSGTGPWWENSIYNSDHLDKLSLSNQRNNPHSLWQHYKKVLKLRKDHAALTMGEYESVPGNSDHIVCFLRHSDTGTIAIIANASPITGSFSLKELKELPLRSTLISSFEHGAEEVLELPPYGYIVLSSD